MGTRKVIYCEGLDHKMPVPNAARIGNLLASGLVVGKDPKTGKVPDSMDEQCHHMFEQIRAILHAEGGTPESVLRISVWVKDRTQREALNQEWFRMYPDPADRPARLTIGHAEMDGNKLIQCEFLAVL